MFVKEEISAEDIKLFIDLSFLTSSFKRRCTKGKEVVCLFGLSFNSFIQMSKFTSEKRCLHNETSPYQSFD